MAEDFDDRFERHEEMIQGLARLWQRQGEINEELRAAVVELKEFNRQQGEINAEIKQLLVTLIERSANGRGT
jgi:hypothetical protein